MSTTAGRSRLPTPSDRLLAAVVALVGLDVVGGLVAVADGLNGPRDAWGPGARLAAPWPMIAAQVLLALLAAGPRPTRPVTTSWLLALACLVSAISGFFDGGLGDPRLTRRHIVLQRVLIAWTAVVGVLAADNADRRERTRPVPATA